VRVLGHRLHYGGVLDERAFMFAADPAGRSAWKPNRLTKTLNRARRAAGIPGVQLRHRRHFMATEMLDVGVPIVVISRRLAHSRTSTTLDRYAQRVPGRDAAAAEMLASRIRKARGGLGQQRQSSYRWSRVGRAWRVTIRRSPPLPLGAGDAA